MWRQRVPRREDEERAQDGDEVVAHRGADDDAGDGPGDGDRTGLGHDQPADGSWLEALCAKRHVLSPARTMNQMLDRIATAAERQRRFVADASHELRTPLTRIRTEVEVDLTHPDRADPVATNQTVLAETARLQQLIDDLLHLARSDAGVGPRTHAPLDLDDVVLAEVSRQRSETSATIDSTHVSAAHLVGDADQLARLVQNLLANAVRHARGVVTVSLTEGVDGIELAVADDGPGVPKADRERVFERFARVDESRGEVGGTGLGLAIVRDITERHGGDARYDPQGPTGARFVVRLPAGGPSVGSNRADPDESAPTNNCDRR